MFREAHGIKTHAQNDEINVEKHQNIFVMCISCYLSVSIKL